MSTQPNTPPEPSPNYAVTGPRPSRETGYKRRHIARMSNIPVLGRSTLLSRVQHVADQEAPTTNFPRLIAFLKFWKWIVPYLRDVVHTNAPYQTYPGGKTGVFRMELPADGALRIAVAADWGTGTQEAATVAKNMLVRNPQYTVHLGDVYYMGEKGEIDENCLGDSIEYTPVTWPRVGREGSFALMGNHEMYSGADAYFNEFLPKLGLLDGQGNPTDPQSASFFCLETEHWIILGLDTGYHSGGVPVFSAVPLVNRLGFLNVDARFDDLMMQWLKNTADSLRNNGKGQKPVLVLTHHQPVSSFEHAFEKPARQLADLGFLNGRDFVWLYGHEHRLTIYEPQTMEDSLRFYPRCIGHGGMPVSVSKLGKPDPKIVYYDPRTHPIDDEDQGTLVGFNGHVELLFEGEALSIEYHDFDDTVLLSETFTAAGTGRLNCNVTQVAAGKLQAGHQTPTEVRVPAYQKLASWAARGLMVAAPAIALAMARRRFARR